MKTSELSSRKRLLIIVCILILIFIAPLLFAWYLYLSQPVWTKTRNHYGHAIKPPINFLKLELFNHLNRRLPHVQWDQKWVVFYVLPLPCTRGCKDNMKVINSVYNGLPLKDRGRVDVVVATFPGHDPREFGLLLDHSYPNFVHVYLKKRNFLRVFSHVKSVRRAIFNGMIYIIDPYGNIIMSYKINTSIKNIKNDVRKLLDASSTLS